MADQPNIPDCFYRVSIKALVTDVQGRFLLLQEADGRWSLPGGGYEHGDISPYEALRRELDEEIGITEFTMEEKPSYIVVASNEYSLYQMNLIYRVGLSSPDFRLSDECVEGRFFSAEEAASIPVFPNVTEFCMQYKQ